MVCFLFYIEIFITIPVKSQKNLELYAKSCYNNRECIYCERGPAVKKLFSCVLTSACLLFGNMFSVYSKDKLPCIYLEGGYAAENNITYVTAYTDTEIDLAAYSITLNFDPSLLEFIDAQNNSQKGNFFSEAVSDDKVSVIWSYAEDCKFDEKLFTAKFKTKSDAVDCVIPVEIGYSVLGNEESEEIPFDAAGCEIKVVGDYLWGDANCDRVLNMADDVTVNQFNMDSEKYSLSKAARLNCDTDSNGVIDSKDCENILNAIINRRKN